MINEDLADESGHRSCDGLAGCTVALQGQVKNLPRELGRSSKKAYKCLRINLFGKYLGSCALYRPVTGICRYFNISSRYNTDIADLEG